MPNRIILIRLVFAEGLTLSARPDRFFVVKSSDGNKPYPEPTGSPTEVLGDAVVGDANRFRSLAKEESSQEQIAILRRMTPGQRWDAAHRLYWTMRRHKAAFIQSQHQDWSGPQVDDEVRRIFSNART